MTAAAAPAVPASTAPRWPVRYLLFIGGLGGLLYGIDIGVIAGALPYLEATASHAWQLSSQQLGFVVAAVLLGSVLSSLFAGMIADLIGRRGAMLLAGLLFTASIPIMALASGYTPLLLGRLLQGISGGLIGVVIPLYLAEVLSPERRGRGAAMFQLLLTVGLVLAALIGLYHAHAVDAAAEAVRSLPVAQQAQELFTVKDHAWRTIFWTCLAPGLLFCAGIFWLSESPRWLVRRGRIDEARRSLQRVLPAADVEPTLAQIQAPESSSSDGRRDPLPLVVIKRGPHWPTALAAIGVAGGCPAGAWPYFGVIATRAGTVRPVAGGNYPTASAWRAVSISITGHVAGAAQAAPP